MRIFMRSLGGVFLVAAFIMLINGCAAQADDVAQNDDTKNVYDFSFHPLVGQDEIALSRFKGKVVMIVNTASQCGYTGQYDGLQKLYMKYGPQGFVIVGVPSHDFGDQEPGSGTAIASFCKLNYGVTFPMAAKDRVTGDAAHPFYRWARHQVGYLAAPKWNFHKYLINRQGELADYFHSWVEPDSSSLTDEIEQLLAEKAPQ